MKKENKGQMNPNRHYRNYVQYMGTAYELAKIDKVQIIEIVQNNKKNVIK